MPENIRCLLSIDPEKKGYDFNMSAWTGRR